jgi:hypothetical protein
MPALHVHFDESGDWSFTPKGSRYLILAVAWTYDPEPLAQALTRLRFDLVRQGKNIDRFHAAEDEQATRNRVVQAIVADKTWSFAAAVMEKRKINPTLREPQRFYPTFTGALLRFVLRSRLRPNTDRVLVYADTLPLPRAKHEGVLKAIKTTCARELAPSGAAHHVFSHSSGSNKWLQVVDYCCWSMSRKWERADLRTYAQLQPRLAAVELDVCSTGDQTTYY